MNKLTMKTISGFCTIIICLLLTVPSQVGGQIDLLLPYQIYSTGLSIINVAWTPDSANLLYQIENYDNVLNRPINGPNTPNSDTWRQYSLATGQTSRGTVWPLQPTLTAQQIQNFQIYTEGNDHSFLFRSPNGRYIAYSGLLPADAGYDPSLGIADLTANTHRILAEEVNIERNHFLGIFEHYNIQWSDDSSAFTLASGLGSELYHISQLNDLNTLVVHWLSTYDGLPIGAERYRATNSFDISANGSKLLLGGFYLTSSIQSSPFVLWDVTTNSGVSLPSEGEVVGATFIHNDQRVLYVDGEGLKQYDTTKNQVVLLNPAINSTWGIGGAYFSPNSRYVAIRAGTQSLYLFEIPSMGLALFRTDTHQANLLQTLDANPEMLDYYTYATGAPSGVTTGSQWVMGDWNGDGIETPGVYVTSGTYAGVFLTTNALGPSSSWAGTWFGFTNASGYNHPISGRFSSANHDCIGVTDGANYPPYGIAFALYYTCDFTQANPPKSSQWLSVVLPDQAWYSGPHEFGAGDFDGDGMDSVAVRRGVAIAFTNVTPPGNAAFNLAQYIGDPHSGTSLFVVGDWNSDGIDSFGLYYTALGRLRGRNDLDWNSGLYPIDQQLDTNIVGTTSISATTWRLR